MLLCLALTLKRSVQCLIKYFDKPQGMNIKISDGVDEILPHFTFWASGRYNQSVFEECGLDM